MTAPTVHVRDLGRRMGIFTIWEKKRNSKEVHWLIECFAEAVRPRSNLQAVSVIDILYSDGRVFLRLLRDWFASWLGCWKHPQGRRTFKSVFCARAEKLYDINLIHVLGIFQIGMAYTFGIVFAITVCSSTSGGHFNPCVTIAMVVFRGFPVRKALRYEPPSSSSNGHVLIALYLDTSQRRFSALSSQPLSFTINGKPSWMLLKPALKRLAQAFSKLLYSPPMALPEPSEITCSLRRHSRARS